MSKRRKRRRKTSLGKDSITLTLVFLIMILLSCQNHAAFGYTCVVIGKVIVDEYLKDNNQQPQITMGGGGPQAAWGAAAALAMMDDTLRLEQESSLDAVLPAQPVVFFGPIGSRKGEAPGWTAVEDLAMQDLLGPVVQDVHLIEGAVGMQTPRIQLWHDDHQDIQWKPLQNSWWGPTGADALWRNRPSAKDILAKTTDIDHLHMILEMGANAAGGGQDGQLLQDPDLLQRLTSIGIEPVAFPDATTGRVSDEDAMSCRDRLANLLGHNNKQLCVIPDKHLFEALNVDMVWSAFDVVAARHGPEGSQILQRETIRGDNRFTTTMTTTKPCTIQINEDQSMTTTSLEKIPIAALQTLTGEPVNPTGAGNAYSAALSTACSQGVSLAEAACLASAIGAVVCEYVHLPPWTFQTLARLRSARREVQSRYYSQKEVP